MPGSVRVTASVADMGEVPNAVNARSAKKYTVSADRRDSLAVYDVGSEPPLVLLLLGIVLLTGTTRAAVNVGSVAVS